MLGRNSGFVSKLDSKSTYIVRLKTNFAHLRYGSSQTHVFLAPKNCLDFSLIHTQHPHSLRHVQFSYEKYGCHLFFFKISAFSLLVTHLLNVALHLRSFTVVSSSFSLYSMVWLFMLFFSCTYIKTSFFLT